MQFKGLLLGLGLTLSLSAFAGFNEGLTAYEKKDYATALKEWRPLAEQGDARAQYYMGVMYDKGDGIPKDDTVAFHWHQKSAEQGYVEAQYYLSLWYELGGNDGVPPKDYALSAAWRHKAAEQGHTEAQYTLGNMYEDGQGVPQNYALAIQWYRKAAEGGSDDAQYDLGRAYDEGQLGLAQDYAEAAHWYRKAAEQDDLRAQMELGRMYEEGEGVPRDLVLAHMVYSRAVTKYIDFRPAIDNRDRLTDLLSPAQLRESKMLATAWKIGSPLPTKSKTGRFTVKRSSKPAKIATAKPSQDCSPPTGTPLRYSDQCYNGDCIRTFENGCQKRFQAAYCYDPFQSQWTWKPDGC